MNKANDYEQKAYDFLRNTKTSFAIRFVKTGKHFVGDREDRDIYEVMLSKGNREYLFNFGDSVRNTQIRVIPSYFPAKRIKQEKDLKEWKSEPINQNLKPSVHNVLSFLTSYPPDDNIDDFAVNYGFERPSEAFLVFNAVNKEYSELCKLFNDSELSELSEIQ